MTAQRRPGHWRGSRARDASAGRLRVRWDRVATFAATVAILVAFWWAAAYLVLRLLGG